jgi:hypothetical protein
LKKAIEEMTKQLEKTDEENEQMKEWLSTRLGSEAGPSFSSGSQQDTTQSGATQPDTAQSNPSQAGPTVPLPNPTGPEGVFRKPELPQPPSLDSSSGETPPYDDLPEGRGIPDDDKDD